MNRRLTGATRAALALASLSLSSCSTMPSGAPGAPGALAPPRPHGASAKNLATSFPAFALAASPSPAAASSPKKVAVAPPMRLTASDGSGLRLVSLTGRAVIEGPLAFTELHLVFENPEDRVIEGNFGITLPAKASVSRFAMRIGDRFQEGEMVETARARRAYEDFLHRRQDPALLEKAAGNEFHARVFPIPARGIKELVLSYAEELPAPAAYVLPLRGLPGVGHIDLAVHAQGERAPLATLDREDFTPDSDLRVPYERLPHDTGLRSGDLVLTRVHPVEGSAPDPLGPAIVLVDTSASRALGFEEEARLVGEVVADIAESAGKSAAVAVGGYDQTTEMLYEGPAAGFGDEARAGILARRAFGASDLTRALDWAAAQAKARGMTRVVLVSDGVATAGEVEPAALKEAAARLAKAGVERLDAVAVGGIRDEALLHTLVTAGLPQDGVVVSAEDGPQAIARRLSRATRSKIPVRVEGARFVYPSVIDGAQEGDEVLVYAEVPKEQTVRVSVGGGAPRTPSLFATERPLLERALAEAKIEELVGRLANKGTDKAATERAIVALSVASRAPSPFTSMLVLETDQDYARFHIDPKALSDILTVSGDRIAVAHRRGAPPPKLAPKLEVAKSDPLGARGPIPAERAQGEVDPPALAAPPPPPGNDPLSARGNMWGSDIGESFGAGGLGLSGIGEGGGGRSEGIGLGSVGTVGHGVGTGTAPGVSGGVAGGVVGGVVSGEAGGVAPAPTSAAPGFGSGHGRLGASHATSAPMVRMGATQVSGRLPPEVIQRIVRQNFGRFRLCYERGLLSHPTLAGRVSVRFVIDRSGAVSSAEDAGSTLPDASVVACVVRAFPGLSFPQPEGGTVTVTYPILFAPEGGAGPVEVATTALTPTTHVPAPPEPAPEPVKPREVSPYTGRFEEVMGALGDREAPHAKEALRLAYAWHEQEPGDVMALVALGEALEALSEKKAAARVYGSIIDLFGARADMRRFAGERLERLGEAGLDLAIDTYEKAAKQRPDHPASHRLLAFARLKHGEYEKAFAAARAGVAQRYPAGRFVGVEKILSEDLGLIAAAWIKARPGEREAILARLDAAGGSRESAPSLRFVLNWETDANDVDFHIEDDRGGHAFFSSPSLPSGGALYADVTTGYGPECFTVRGPKESRAGSYTMKAHYYARGPMGYGMGKLQIIEHDGKGGITFEERPFVVMVDRAFVDLGGMKR